MNTKKYPFRCKQHPKAEIRHSWDEEYFRSDNNLGNPVTRNEKFECAVCGKRLAPNQRDASCFEA